MGSVDLWRCAYRSATVSHRTGPGGEGSRVEIGGVGELQTDGRQEGRVEESASSKILDAGQPYCRDQDLSKITHGNLNYDTELRQCGRAVSTLTLVIVVLSTAPVTRVDSILSRTFSLVREKV